MVLAGHPDGIQSAEPADVVWHPFHCPLRKKEEEQALTVDKKIKRSKTAGKMPLSGLEYYVIVLKLILLQ